MEYNKDIYNFIYPQENDLLGSFSSRDLQIFNILLNDFYLEKRDVLGLSKDVTFGLELEYENDNNSCIKNNFGDFKIENNLDNKWIWKIETSVEKGGEINSPILHDDVFAWCDLTKVCDFIGQYAEATTKTASHIHIGSNILTDKKENWLKFMKLWAVYENIIYRFSYGETLMARSGIGNYSKMMADLIFKRNPKILRRNADLKSIIDSYSESKYQAISLKKAKPWDESIINNTIEFRCPNGTLNPVIWQNNTNFFVRLLEYSKSMFYNDDIIEARYKYNVNKYNDLILYSQIYLEQALELADMIFNNNLDKIYFLRQYLKSFENGNKPFEKSKIFTKK